MAGACCVFGSVERLCTLSYSFVDIAALFAWIRSAFFRSCCQFDRYGTAIDIDCQRSFVVKGL